MISLQESTEKKIHFTMLAFYKEGHQIIEKEGGEEEEEGKDKTTQMFDF